MASPLPGHARKTIRQPDVRKRPGARPRPFSALFNVARKPAGSNHHGSRGLSLSPTREQHATSSRPKRSGEPGSFDGSPRPSGMTRIYTKAGFTPFPRSSHGGTGSPFERRNGGLNSFDW